MSAPIVTGPDPGDRSAPEGGRPIPGRVTVDTRVLRKVVQESAARAFGVERSKVSADLFDYRDGVALRLASPLPVPDLADSDAIRSSPTVPERIGQLQQSLSDDLTRMMGRRVTRVDVSITGAVVEQRRRVR